ncbi:Uncharacterised protein [Mycobacteroides abscessus subsp. abscessus]|nr:Uncharacterised protein [Mycobacteroides abscessus subsp. abscessus]
MGHRLPEKRVECRRRTTPRAPQDDHQRVALLRHPEQLNGSGPVRAVVLPRDVAGGELITRRGFGGGNGRA